MKLREREKAAFFTDHKEGNDNTCSLGGHSGQGSSRRAHVEHGYQQQISGNVDDTCDGNRHQRGFGIADSAEHSAQHIVGHDEDRAGSADSDIG